MGDLLWGVWQASEERRRQSAGAAAGRESLTGQALLPQGSRLQPQGSGLLPQRSGFSGEGRRRSTQR